MNSIWVAVGGCSPLTRPITHVGCQFKLRTWLSWSRCTPMSKKSSAKATLSCKREKFSLIPKDHSHEQPTMLCKSASEVVNHFYMPYTMGEHMMALNEKLQALAAFEDAADTGATAQHLGHREEDHSLQMTFANVVLSVFNVLRPKNPLLPQNGPFRHAPCSRGHAICNRRGALQCIQKRQGSPRSLR